VKTPRRTIAVTNAPRRRLVWARTDYVSGALTSDAVDLLAAFRTAAQYGAQPIGITIARVHIVGDLSTGSGADGIVGGLMIDDRNHAVADIPRPMADEGQDWMMFQPWPLVGESGRTGTSVKVSADVRSQRRLDEVGQTLWLSWDSRSATLTYQLQLWVSVLLRLP